MPVQNQGLLSTLRSLQKQPLLYQCLLSIEGLLQDLHKKEQVILQQTQLIASLQESKQFYEQEYRKNSFQEEFFRLQQEHNQTAKAATVHQKMSKDLQDELQKVRGQMDKIKRDMQVAQQALREKDRIIGQQQEQHLTVLLQKELLEKQWAKVVRAVGKKISTIMQQDTANPQQEEKNNSRKMPVEVSNLMRRAEQMVKVIDRQVAVEELEELFAWSTEKKPREWSSARRLPLGGNRLQQAEAALPFN